MRVNNCLFYLSCSILPPFACSQHLTDTSCGRGSPLSLPPYWGTGNKLKMHIWGVESCWEVLWWGTDSATQLLPQVSANLLHGLRMSQKCHKALSHPFGVRVEASAWMCSGFPMLMQECWSWPVQEEGQCRGRKSKWWKWKGDVLHGEKAFLGVGRWGVGGRAGPWHLCCI